MELSNGGLALVLEVSDTAVKLDCNSMMAGSKMTFELELTGIEKRGSD